MRAQECICTAGMQKTSYFLWINIYTNINSTNGGPFLCFIILFRLSGVGGCKMKSKKKLGTWTVYMELLQLISNGYIWAAEEQAISWLTRISQF